jgi:hypothetical protein
VPITTDPCAAVVVITSDGSGVCVAPCTTVRCAARMTHVEPDGTVMLASVFAAGSAETA